MMLSLYPKKSSRFSKKLDTFFWWFLKFLPLILLLIANIGFFTSKPFQQYFVDDGDWSDFFIPGTSLVNVLGYLGFDIGNPISDILFSIFSYQDSLPFLRSFTFCSYLSYLVFIELAHLLYDVVVFIPRLARKWINMACQDDS